MKADECYATGSERSSKYHYEFLYKRGFFSTRAYENYQAECDFRSDSYECYQQRLILDSKFNDLNTSEYNIYDKCYRGKNDSIDLSYVNTGCEDEAGLVNYMNDVHFQGNWNIRPKEWKPCNTKVFQAYLSGKNSYYLLPTLIQNSLRIVSFLFYFSGCIQAIWTPKFRSCQQRNGSDNSRTNFNFQS